MRWPAFLTPRRRPASLRPRERCRRFGVLDGMILVVVAGVGFAGFRAGLELYSDGYYRVEMTVEVTLLLVSGLTLIFRLRRPRPSLRRVARQPGAVACFAVVAAQVVGVVQMLVRDLAVGDHEFFSGVGPAIWYLLSNVNLYLGFVVPGSWLWLVAAWGWRPEPGWIDLIGRSVGWAWLAWLVVGPLFYWYELHTNSFLNGQTFR